MYYANHKVYHATPSGNDGLSIRHILGILLYSFRKPYQVIKACYFALGRSKLLANNPRMKVWQKKNEAHDRYCLSNKCSQQVYRIQSKFLYYIDRSVLLKNTPLVKFIRNYIRNPSCVFSISSLVRILMTSFPALSAAVRCTQSVKNGERLICLYNKKKITRWLEDMNFIFSC